MIQFAVPEALLRSTTAHGGKLPDDRRITFSLTRAVTREYHVPVTSRLTCGLFNGAPDHGRISLTADNRRSTNFSGRVK